MEAHSSGRNDVDFVALSLGYRKKRIPSLREEPFAHIMILSKEGSLERSII